MRLRREGERGVQDWLTEEGISWNSFNRGPSALFAPGCQVIFSLSQLQLISASAVTCERGRLALAGQILSLARGASTRWLG